MSVIVGVDGCRGGWIALIDDGDRLSVGFVDSLGTLLGQTPSDAVVAIDVPIGLTDAGPRECDVEARRLLGPRRSSVFPAPIRGVLDVRDYLEACSMREAVDGRRMSKQAFALLPKIREVDIVLRTDLSLQARVREVHPEVCFAVWSGAPMTQHKSKPEGLREREALIDAKWPDARSRLAEQAGFAQRDDLNDAFAALWTADRIRMGIAMTLPAQPMADAVGLTMEMVA